MHIVLNSLDEKLKLASDAGLYCNLQATMQGIAIYLSGFKSHTSLLLREIVGSMARYQFTPTEFQDASKKVSRR